MRVRELLTRLLSPFALSNATIAWASSIGALGTLVFVPDHDGSQWWHWPLIALASQAGFAAVALIGRHFASAARPAQVAAVLACAGAVRGILIAVGASAATHSPLDAGSLLTRAVNSTIICVVGSGLIGATLAWQAEFRTHYRILRDRALLLDRARAESTPLDPVTLAAWTSMKTTLDVSLSGAHSLLLHGTSESDFRQAATLLSSAVEAQLRPGSREMLRQQPIVRNPLGTRALLVEMLRRWQPPIALILLFFAVVLGPGAIVRVGVSAGLAFTLGYLLVLGVGLTITSRLAAIRPASAPAIALTTLVGLPLLIYLLATPARPAISGDPGDWIPDAIVAIQTPISITLISMAVIAVRDRAVILHSLQVRIDREVVELLERESPPGQDAAQLSLFIHHSVQSELSAISMQLREAAQSEDETTRDEVRHSVIARLTQLEALDPDAPPWLRQSRGIDRIEEISQAWAGILDIRVALPPVSSCRTDQWFVASQIIEEALANAARHGDATKVTISGARVDNCLTLTISDDGRPGSAHDTATSQHSGLGSLWLDRFAPGDWQLERTGSGATLSVTIR